MLRKEWIRLLLRRIDIRSLHVSVLLVVVVNAFGCNSSPSIFNKNFYHSPFFPRRALNEAAITDSLEKKYFHPDIIDKYYEEGPQTRLKRNEILNGLIFLTDLHYVRYERELVTGRAAADTLFDIAVIGVTSAATLTGGEAAKSLLSTIATGLTGTRLAIDKNFFREQATPVLITKMRASHLQKLNVLLDQMREEPVDYSLERGLADLLEYYNAGTIIVALQDVAKEAASAAKQAEEKKEEILKKSDAATKDQSPGPP